jgi:TRAP transporter TAXI family solute receptor
VIRILAVCAALVLGAASAAAQVVAIGSNPPGTIAYPTAASIAKVASGDNFQVRVQPNGGPNVGVPQVAAGELDFQIINMVVAVFAYTGTGDFQGKAYPDVRLAATLFPLRLGMFVRKDAPIRAIKDLKGKRISTEYRTQINSALMVEGILASAGLGFADVVGVPAPHVARGADDFAAGRVDATFFSLGAGKVQEVSATVGGVRFLSLDQTPAALAAIHKFAPGTYIETVQPAPAYVGIVGATNILAMDLVLLAGAKTPDETVYRIVKAMHDRKPDLVASLGAFREADEKKLAKQSAVPYHPGAIRFFRESGQWPPKP